MKNAQAGGHSSTPVKRMLDDLLCYDIATNEWQILHNGRGGMSCPTRRKGCTLTAYGDRSLFLFGGAGPGTTNNDLWEFNLQSKQWIDRTYDIACQLATANNIVNIEMDLSRANWSPEMSCKIGQALAEHYPHLYPAPRAYHSAVEHDGRLIIYGGHDVRDQSSALWVYEIKWNEWRRVPLVGVSKMIYSDEGTVHPGIRFGVTSCVYGDGLYIFGGQQNSKLVGVSLWRLSLSSLQWQKVVTTGTPPMPQTYAASALFGNRWIIHGGSSTEDVFAETYELNLDTFHWYPCPSMNTVVTLEGHTSAFLTSESGISTLTLFGGATKGPHIPESPVLELSIALVDASILHRMDNLKVEDFVIRPTGAAQMLWESSRARSELSNQLNEMAREQHQAREFSEKCLKEALAQCQDLSAKQADLSEEMEKVLADKKVMAEKYSVLFREKYQYENVINDYKERRASLEQRVEELTLNQRTLMSKQTEISEKYGALLNLMPAVAKALKYAQVVTQPKVIQEELEVNELQDKLAEVQRLAVNALKLVKDALSTYKLHIDIPEPMLLEVETGQFSFGGDSSIPSRLISNKSKDSVPGNQTPREEDELLSEVTDSGLSIKPGLKTRMITARDVVSKDKDNADQSSTLRLGQSNSSNNTSPVSFPSARKRKQQLKHGRDHRSNHDGSHSDTTTAPAVGSVGSVCQPKSLSHPRKAAAAALAVAIDKASPKTKVSNLKSSPIKKSVAARGFPVLADLDLHDPPAVPSNTPTQATDDIGTASAPSAAAARSMLQANGVLASPPHPPSGYVNQQQVFTCSNNGVKQRAGTIRTATSDASALGFSPRSEDGPHLGVLVDGPKTGITRGVCSYSSAVDGDGGYGRLELVSQKSSSSRRPTHTSCFGAGLYNALGSDPSSSVGSAPTRQPGINRSTQCGPGVLKLFASSSNGGANASYNKDSNSRHDIMNSKQPIIPTELSITKGISAGENSPMRLVS